MAAWSPAPRRTGTPRTETSTVRKRWPPRAANWPGGGGSGACWSAAAGTRPPRWSRWSGVCYPAEKQPVNPSGWRAIRKVGACALRVILRVGLNRASVSIGLKIQFCAFMSAVKPHFFRPIEVSVRLDGRHGCRHARHFHLITW